MDIHSFISELNKLIDTEFPNTIRIIANSSDYIKDTIFELRENNKKLRYSPYEMFSSSDDYDYTILELVEKWRKVKETI